MAEDTDKGEFVAEAELLVLRALWRDAIKGDTQEHLYLAKLAGAPVSMIERVECLLFPEGM